MRLKKCEIFVSGLQLSFQVKVGVMYCRAGQSTEEEMYNNETAGPALEEFFQLLGEKIRLKGFTKYRAQLDTKSNYTHCIVFGFIYKGISICRPAILACRLAPTPKWLFCLPVTSHPLEPLYSETLYFSLAFFHFMWPSFLLVSLDSNTCGAFQMYSNPWRLYKYLSFQTQIFVYFIRILWDRLAWIS